MPCLIYRGTKMQEVLMLAVIFNVILLVIAYFVNSRAVVIISSLVWVLIGFALYQEYADTLLLAILYMIAFAQIFIPLNQRNLTG